MRSVVAGSTIEVRKSFMFFVFGCFLTALSMLERCCICSSAFVGSRGRIAPGETLDRGGGAPKRDMTSSGDGAPGGWRRGEATWKLGGRGGGGGPPDIMGGGNSGDSARSGRT